MEKSTGKILSIDFAALGNVQLTPAYIQSMLETKLAHHPDSVERVVLSELRTSQGIESGWKNTIYALIWLRDHNYRPVDLLIDSFKETPGMILTLYRTFGASDIKEKTPNRTSIPYERALSQLQS